MDIAEAQEACDIIYSKIVETGERVSADRIKEVCQALINSPEVARITTSLVGERCVEKWGGPRAQSITNKPGTLAALVKAYNVLKQAKRGKPFAGPRAGKGLQAQISDPGIALQVRALVSDLDERTRQVQSLKGLIENHFIVNSDGTVVPKVEVLVPPENDARIPTQVELTSIAAFLRAQNLERFGMAVDAKGRIVEGRQTFMEAPMVKFLQRLTGAG